LYPTATISLSSLKGIRRFRPLWTSFSLSESQAVLVAAFAVFAGEALICYNLVNRFYVKVQSPAGYPVLEPKPLIKHVAVLYT